MSSTTLPRWFGDYVLVERIGKGGMGEVHLAVKPGGAGIPSVCVVKSLRRELGRDREYVARFTDEAKVVVRLAHKNIVSVFDVGEVAKQLYLAMEHVPGRDLSAVLEAANRAGRRIPAHVALHAVSEVLDGLSYAHRVVDAATGAALGLVHRDVSPANVMASFEGELKLIDFGLATSTLKQEKTESGVVLGKVAYLPPEQARGEQVDVRADVWSAGVVLYELLAGERYYEGMSIEQMWRVAPDGDHRPGRMDQLPADLREIIEQATSPRAQDRFSSCDALTVALAPARAARQPGGRSELRAFLAGLFGPQRAEEEERRARLVRDAHAAPSPVEHSVRIAVRPTSDERTLIAPAGAARAVALPPLHAEATVLAHQATVLAQLPLGRPNEVTVLARDALPLPPEADAPTRLAVAPRSADASSGARARALADERTVLAGDRRRSGLFAPSSTAGDEGDASPPTRFDEDADADADGDGTVALHVSPGATGEVDARDLPRLPRGALGAAAGALVGVAALVAVVVAILAGTPDEPPAAPPIAAAAPAHVAPPPAAPAAPVLAPAPLALPQAKPARTPRPAADDVTPRTLASKVAWVRDRCTGRVACARRIVDRARTLLPSPSTGRAALDAFETEVDRCVARCRE